MQRVDALISEKQTITNKSRFCPKKETSGRKNTSKFVIVIYLEQLKKSYVGKTVNDLVKSL